MNIFLPLRQHREQQGFDCQRIFKVPSLFIKELYKVKWETQIFLQS